MIREVYYRLYFGDSRLWARVEEHDDVTREITCREDAESPGACLVWSTRTRRRAVYVVRLEESPSRPATAA